MNRYQKIIIILCLGGFLLALTAIQVFRGENALLKKEVTIKKPNIVLINIDDLGWKDLGFMGSHYYDTPHLDRLAKEGMVFTNAYANAANCAPSRACLLSGLNTPRHGVFTVGSSERGDSRTRKLVPIKNRLYLHDSIYTLPEMMKSAGYITANIGKWHVGKDPTTQGIDYNVGGSSRGNPGTKGYFSPYNIDFIKDGPKGEYLTDRLVQEAISFITKNKDSSFFAYLPLYTVHTPLQGKKAWLEKYKDKAGTNGQDNPVYAAMVSSMDENVGKILRALDTLKLSESTLVVFTSDNGGIRAISNQHPLRGGKGSYYEGGIRVPLIIRWPGHVLPGTQNNNRVSNLDLMPTFQEISYPRKKTRFLDGISFANQFMDVSKTERDLFFHFPIYLQAYNPKQDDGRDPLFRTRPGAVVISGDWKLHHYFEDDGLELYHLNEDPGERENMVELYPDKTRELLKKLSVWQKNVNAPIPNEKNANYDSNYEHQKLAQAIK